MKFFARLSLVAMAVLVSACANETAPPPPPISAQQFAAYRLTNVTVDTSEATISWPAAERDFAASKGIKQTSNSSAFGSDEEYQVSDEDRALFTAYEDAIKSEEAEAYYRTRVADVMKPRLAQALTPAFTGEKPLNLMLKLRDFTIRSSAAVAFGGDEGASGAVTFTEAESGTPVAISPDLAYVSSNDTMVPSVGGLAGLAVSLVASAAINVVSDAVLDSADNLSTNYAQTTREWLQLEPYAYPE